MKTFGGKSRRILSLSGAIDLSASQLSNMPTDLAKKWIGGDCGLRRLIGTRSAAGTCDGPHPCTPTRREDDDDRAWLHPIKEIDDILVGHADAAG
jgi:hypothetical protein